MAFLSGMMTKKKNNDVEEYTEENLLKAKAFLFMMLLEKNEKNKMALTASEIDLGFALSHDPTIKKFLEGK